MKKQLLAGVALAVMTSYANAADSTISGFTAGSALGGTEVLPMDQGVSTVKVTANQIRTFTNTFPQVVASGTSGGIPYFSSTTALSASGLLTANALMVGGGSGAAPSTVTTGAGVVTALGLVPNATGAVALVNGAITVGNCLKWSATGVQDQGAPCGSGGSSTLTANSTLTSGYTAGQIVYSDGTKIQALGAGTSTTLLHGGTSPSYGAVNLATDTTGALPVTIDARTTTTESVTTASASKLVTLSNVGATAVSLATPVGNTGFATTFQNLNTGSVTITPAAGTINGAATYVLQKNEGVTVVSDGSNYQISGGPLGVSVGAVVTGTCTSGHNLYNNGGVIGCQANGGGGGTVTVTGSPLNTYLTGWSAATTITGTASALLSATAPEIVLGVNATTLGAIKMFGSTSGDLTIQPSVVAGTASVATFPANTGTVAELNLAQAYTAQQNFAITSVSTAAANIAWGLNANQVTVATLTSGVGPYTLDNPTNIVAGGTYIIYIVQPGAGSVQTLTGWGTYYKFPGAAKPTITATLGATDIITCVAKTTTELDCVWQGAFG